jgi:hypothetical protein
MKAKDIVAQVVKTGIVPLLKERGFRKKGLTFHRSRGDTEQLINIQLSHGNFASEGRFYVNVGLNVLALRSLGGDGQGNVVIGGQTIDLGLRLENLISSAPAWWEVDSTTDPSALGQELRRAIELLLQILDRIDSGPALVRELRLDHGFHKVLRARIRYVEGDVAGAERDLALVAAEFADRKGISVHKLAQQHRLTAIVRE